MIRGGSTGTSGGKGDEKKAPTIYDVARAAGVASSTVSRAFARPGRVSFETAQRIHAAAEQLGYRSKSMDHSAAGSRSKMIALVIADIANPVYFEMIRGAEAAASDAGYTMLLFNSQESDTRERQALERAMSMVDGIVLSSSRMSDSAIRQMAKQKPTMVMNRAVADVSSVVTDNPRGMRRAAEHLGELGHSELMYLAGPEASWADGMRWRSLREAGMELEIRTRRGGPFAPTQHGGAEAAAQWAAHPSSAVVAYNDQIAIGFLREIARMGMTVPDDVSVVGFDNTFGAELVTPPLTTVASPLYSLGSTAVNNLLAIAGGARSMSGRPVVLPAKLVVRESTAAWTKKRQIRGK
ncbi:LacI family DNA-binding transcriptional regulator [Arthrobacter castelli]|uniref:LacI family DNA-binding transcriptional regulator n=1 Tax=Arthrobacter castelli TaxID=271431 RepID=UPI0012DD38B9|nr:LacI family DNA-binding transcriptional regulator [Arthrobacter castelli]